jgi:osmotically-inducible protein OsmY
MRPDTEIKRDVEAELAWDPDIDASDIAIAVRDGVVTMTGFVGSYFQKIEAEAIAKRIKGVLGVANDISIRLPSEHERPDPDIARDVVNMLKSEFPLSADGVRVVVRKRWVWLEGNVEWNEQRRRMVEAARHVAGVRGISNQLALRPRVAPVAIKRRGGAAPAGRVRCRSRRGRSQWQRGAVAGNRAFVGRAPGGRTRRVAGAGRHQCRQLPGDRVVTISATTMAN